MAKEIKCEETQERAAAIATCIIVAKSKDVRRAVDQKEIENIRRKFHTIPLVSYVDICVTQQQSLAVPISEIGSAAFQMKKKAVLTLNLIEA